jgi:uncharacterized surface protein with fasciclin (FAS1) repeats
MMMSKKFVRKSALLLGVFVFLFTSIFGLQVNYANSSDGTTQYPDAPGARATFGGLDGTELFLGGNYMELGISNWGDFGTEGEKPENFRGTLGGEIQPFNGTNSIGMSADHDGYFYGRDLPVDYYLPGTPEERFVVGYKVNGISYANSNSALMWDKNMPTTVANESDINNGLLKAKITSTWLDTMQITQIISFKVNDKFYRNQVTITNLTDQTWESGRYMRSVDPDNSVYRGGSFVTSNTVTHTIAEDGKAVVQAETMDSFTTDPMYQEIGSRIPFFYYSKDPAAKASVFGFTNLDPYISDAYENPQEKGIPWVEDVAITITWDSGELTPGESKSFIYYTSLDERDFEEVEENIEEAQRYDVTFRVEGGNGILSAEVEDEAIQSGDKVEEGSTIIFTATFDEGYAVKDWIVDGLPIGLTSSTYTIDSLAEDVDVLVEFQPILTPTIVDILRQRDDLTLLLEALENEGLDIALEGEGPFTLFAPKDEAFLALLEALESSIPELLADENLTDILLYHVIGEKLMSEDLQDGMEIETLNGQKLKITIGSIFVNEALVVEEDIETRNGVIHIIDQVLFLDEDEEDEDDQDLLAHAILWRSPVRLDKNINNRSTLPIKFSLVDDEGRSIPQRETITLIVEDMYGNQVAEWSKDKGLEWKYDEEEALWFYHAKFQINRLDLAAGEYKLRVMDEEAKVLGDILIKIIAPSRSTLETKQEEPKEKMPPKKEAISTKINQRKK